MQRQWEKQHGSDLRTFSRPLYGHSVGCRGLRFEVVFTSADLMEHDVISITKSESAAWALCDRLRTAYKRGQTDQRKGSGR